MANILEKLFGLRFKSEKNKEKDVPRTFVEPDIDGAHPLEYSSGAFFASMTTLQVEDTIRRAAEQIRKYREIAMHPEADQAIDNVVTEAITSSRTEELVTIDLENVDLSDKIKDRIREEFKEALRLLNYKRKAYDMFRDFYIDGRLYYHKIIDEKKPKEGIQEVRQIDSTAITKVVELERQTDQETNAEVIERQREYFLYNRTYTSHDRKSSYSASTAISPDAVTFVHSGIYNEERNMILGHLHKAIKPLNQLRMVEDAAVIYRLTRAPERRAFYIDVGRLPRHKAEAHVKEVMLRHRNNLKYDATTGELMDNKKHMHMLEDFFLPRFDGSRGTEIDTLQAGANLGEMDDVMYFQRKFYKSLNVPVSRLDTESGFALGRVAEISRDEVNFTKFVDRALVRFSGVFEDILGTNLVLKGIMRKDEWEAIRHDIFYNFLKDSFFTELKELEVMRERVTMVQEMNDFNKTYFSKDYIRRNVLQQDEETIEEIKKQIEIEKKEEPDDEEEDGGFPR